MVPLAVWHKIYRTNPVVPLWHVVSDAELPHVSSVYQFRNTRQFSADLEFLLRHYSPVTEDEVIRHLHDGAALPQRGVLLTFDDGFREIHDIVAPLLRAKGAPATFFLTTSTLDNRDLCFPQKKSLLMAALARRQSAATLGEAGRLLSLAGARADSTLEARIQAVSFGHRKVLDHLAHVLECDFQRYLGSQRPYVTSEQVEGLLRQGFTVGAHSVDHPPYDELTLDEQLFQTRNSVRELSERFRMICRSFAFPYRDRGVSLGFFRAIFGDGQLKVSFGTGGLAPHVFPYNLPRFSTERTDLSAADVLAGQFGRSLMSRGLGLSDRLAQWGK